jgi:hypothetical protein
MSVAAIVQDGALLEVAMPSGQLTVPGTLNVPEIARSSLAMMCSSPSGVPAEVYVQVLTKPKLSVRRERTTRATTEHGRNQPLLRQGSVQPSSHWYALRRSYYWSEVNRHRSSTVKMVTAVRASH